MCFAGPQPQLARQPAATPPPPAPTPRPEAAASAAAGARSEEARRTRTRRGRASTILTGPLGLQNQAQVARKTLLGQ